MALLMMMPDRLMMPSVPKNESGCPVASSQGNADQDQRYADEGQERTTNRIELQDDRKHHHGERNRKAGCQLLVRLRAFLDLAADGHVITAAHVHLIEPGLDRFQQLPGGHRGAAGGDRDRPFLVLAPDPGEIEPGLQPGDLRQRDQTAVLREGGAGEAFQALGGVRAGAARWGSSCRLRGRSRPLSR